MLARYKRCTYRLLPAGPLQICTMTAAKKPLAFSQDIGFPGSATSPVLQISRVTAPRLAPDYFRRAQLLQRCQPLRRRLTVLKAPCGFGKTALLTDLCHRERQSGAVVAWLRLDEADSRRSLSAYLAFAFTRAGLDLAALHNLWQDEHRSRHPGYRIGLLFRAIENYGKHCLLVFDEVERLNAADAIELIDLVLRRGPPNLHFVLAMRESPPGLDLASSMLGYRGIMLTVEDLRFSSPEMAVFLGQPLSREELVTAVERTEGWPAALRIHRQLGIRKQETGDAGEVRRYEQVITDFLGARLIRGFSEASRDFLLDVALFERIDAPLVDAVMGEDCSQLRLETLSKLDGLVRTVDPAGPTVRLHPMVKAYCAKRRMQEDPGRFQMLHRRLALAIARRGNLNEALRHSAAAGDHAVTAEILEGAGGVGMMLSAGVERMMSVGRELTDEMVSAYPRLALMHCMGLVIGSNLREGQLLYEAVSRKTRGFERDREGGDDRALQVDHLIVRSTLSAFTCQSIGSVAVHRMLRDVAELAQDERIAPGLRGFLYSILCIADQLRANFELSRRRATRAKECFAVAGARIGGNLVDLQGGIVAMAQGRVRDAIRGYTCDGLPVIADILRTELHLERNRLRPASSSAVDARLRLAEIAGWFDVHAAAHGNAVEMSFAAGGFEGALETLDVSLDWAAGENFGSLVRLLSAQRVSYLAASGSVDAASRAWRQAGFPDLPAELSDLHGQSWREMEAISCARIGLLDAEGEFGAARRLAEELRDVALRRGLQRTLMRCLALWMRVEFRSGDFKGAVAKLLEFLHRLRATDYSRPLVRDREVSSGVLERLLGMDVELRIRGVAESLQRQLRPPETLELPAASRYSDREIDVLRGLESGQRDKQIARGLGLSEHGVRYHLNKIYRKLGADGRIDAVRRARSRGVIQPS